MLRFFLIIFFLNISAIKSQNLIPNSGFEKHQGDSLFYWIQPDPPRKHFEYNTIKILPPHSGFCINGLCLSVANKSEYLHVKLSEQLVQGKSYYLRMYLRKISNYPNKLGAIAWFFSNTDSLTTIKYGAIHKKPEVIFLLPLEDPISEWLVLENNYIADGTENYLSIGNFFLSEEILKIEKENNEDIDFLNKDKIQVINKGNKVNRRSRKDEELFRAQIKEIAAKRASRQKENVHDRYYFDDFCLAQIEENNSWSCVDYSESIKEIELNVFFDESKSDLTSVSLTDIDNFIKDIKIIDIIEVIVRGHTDESGESVKNQLLSEYRAKSVVDYLIEVGIPSKIISFEGLGSTSPISINDRENSKYYNRRVTITVYR